MPLPTTANVTRPRAFGYSFRLGDLFLRGAVAADRPLDITTADLQAPRVNTASGSEDLRNEYGEIFSRSSFVGGEGLDFAHQRDLPDDAVTRFWDSQHIDISNPAPGQPARVTLLPTTGVIETSADTNLHLAVGDSVNLFMGEGTSTRRTTDPTAATPTFASSNPHAGESAVAVLDTTTLGNVMYAALGVNGLHKMSADTWTSMNNTDTRKVWAAKGLLLASTGTVLNIVTLADGTYTPVVTLPAGQEWLDVKNCGHAILAAASDGTVYALANNDATPAVLTLMAETPMPAGEIPYCVESDRTFVFVGTRETTPSGAIGRMYRMTLEGSYELSNGQLLRQWGDQSATIDHAPRQIIANRKGVVWGVYETGGSWLWRYDSASGGVSRHLDLHASGLVVDIISLTGRLFATVAGHGLRREAVGTYETSGYLIGPLGDLFNASQKSWAGATLDHDTLTSDCRVELYYTTDPAALTDSTSTSWVRVKNIVAGKNDAETVLSGVDARFLAGMVKVYANTALTASPSVRGFSFRAYPGPGDIEITLAINTSDMVTRPGFRSLRSRGQGQLVYDALKNREGRAADLEILATGEIFRGVVKQVATRIPDEVDRGSASVVTMLTFRGRRTAPYTIHGDVADGAIESFNSVYLTARSGGGTVQLSPSDTITATANNVGQVLILSSFTCYELMIAFDTSAVPDSATIVSATLELAAAGNLSDTDFTLEARLHDWGTTVATGDYVAGASLSSKTLLASISTAGLAEDEYFTLSDVPALAANINTTGFTRIVLCSSRMTAGTEPTGNEYLRIYTGDHPFFKPRLTIVTTDG